MSFINPLVGSISQGTVAEQQQAAEKARQIGRAQALEKNVAARDDEMEHQVEIAEEFRPIENGRDQAGKAKSRPAKPSPGRRESNPADRPRLDLTA